GGCIAESLVFGQKTTGAGNDIERATDLARKMVCEWGMSDAIGPVAIAKKEENVFLGREFSKRHDLSQKTAEIVDSEIHRFITVNYDRGVEILKTKMDVLHAMAAALLERETLEREEIDLLMEGKPLPAFVTDSSSSSGTDTAASVGTESFPQVFPNVKPKTEVA
ncbi:MAG: cell division protein FtsH, partial [Deltaproteobacteria bacterium]